MTGHLRFALLALASLLLLQFAAAEFDSAACAENCRFVVVPSLGPAGPAGPPGANGTNGINGKDGAKGASGMLDIEYIVSSMSFSGNFQVGMTTTFMRISRQVTMMLTGVRTMYGTTASPQVSYTSMPVQFRPRQDAFFSIPGVNASRDTFLCMRVKTSGEVTIFGGACGLAFPVTDVALEEKNGWETSTVTWLTL